MKHPLLLPALATLLLIMCSNAHAQDPVWLNQYGNSSDNHGLYLEYDGAAGLYGVGRVRAPQLEMGDTTVTVLGFEDVLLAKWDTSGVLLWARTAGGACQTELDGGGQIVYDDLVDNVIISGQFDCPGTSFGDHILNGSQNGGKDRFIAAYDDSGECLWARSASGYNISFSKLLVDNASQVFAFGRSRTAWI